jgi:carbamoyl-phosphate synthase large subunit
VLLEHFRRAMGELGISGKLVATDISPQTAALQVVDEKFIVPQVKDVQYIPELKRIVEEHEIGLIVPLTDLDLHSLTRHREEFLQLGCEVMIGPEETVRACRDKKEFSERLRRAGMPAIRTFSLEEFRSAPFYPCFIKPMRGSGGLGTSRIGDENELRAHVATFGEQLLVQDYVPGREYTIDVYRTRDGDVRCIVPRQRLVVRSGEVDKGVTVHDDALIEATQKLTDLMPGLWGVFCCQCRRPDGDEAFFFEINPRFGGGAPLSIAAGVDLPRYLMEEVTGREISARLGEFTPNLVLMRYSADLFEQVDDPTELPGFEGPFFR